jgi:phosphoglycolate/pyridoxal phosphate phosphatase family enzyme
MNQTHVPLSRLDLSIFDIDGVIVRGKLPMPGAAEAVAFLRGRGVAVRFLTNNSTLTRQHYADMLSAMGIPCQPDEVMNSAHATALYLLERNLAKGDIVVVGETGLIEELANAGIPAVHWSRAERADAVVVGLDRQFNYEALKKAQQWILDGAAFVASNRDGSYPVEDGLIPGAGSVVAAIEAAAATKPHLVGKPNTFMLDKVMAEVGAEPQSTLLIGDRLETDIELGRRAGAWTALVLTGVTDRQAADKLPPARRPHIILETLRDLPALFPPRQGPEASYPGG